MRFYISRHAMAILWLSLMAPQAPSLAAEPSTSSMTCRLYLRVRELPPKDPVLMLRRLASINADIVVGLPAGAMLEPIDPGQDEWRAVRWNGTFTGFVNSRYTEEVAHCVPSTDQRSQLQADATRSPLPAVVRTLPLHAVQDV